MHAEAPPTWSIQDKRGKTWFLVKNKIYFEFRFTCHSFHHFQIWEGSRSQWTQAILANGSPQIDDAMCQQRRWGQGKSPARKIGYRKSSFISYSGPFLAFSLHQPHCQVSHAACSLFHSPDASAEGDTLFLCTQASRGWLKYGISHCKNSDFDLFGDKPVWSRESHHFISFQT